MAQHAKTLADKTIADMRADKVHQKRPPRRSPTRSLTRHAGMVRRNTRAVHQNVRRNSRRNSRPNRAQIRAEIVWRFCVGKTSSRRIFFRRTFAPKFFGQPKLAPKLAPNSHTIRHTIRHTARHTIRHNSPADARWGVQTESFIICLQINPTFSSISC